MTPPRLTGGLLLSGLMACAEEPSSSPRDGATPDAEAWPSAAPEPDAAPIDPSQREAGAPHPPPDVVTDAAAEATEDTPPPMSPTGAPRAPLTVRDGRVRPLCPLSGSTVGSSFPTLQWTATDAASVTLELCRDRGMGRDCRPPRVVRGDSARVTDVPLAPGQWFWRVRPASGPAGDAPVWQLRVPHGDRRATPDTSYGVGSDLDGDGLGDLPYRIVSREAADALSVHYGAPASGVSRGRAVLVTEATPGASVTAARRVGDVDGDGFVDVAAVVVGEMAPRELRVLVMRGGEGGLLGPEVAYTVTGQEGSVDLRAAGDVDRDGYADVIFSVGGVAKVLRGGAAALRSVTELRAEAAGELTLVEGGADFDGDGLNDLLTRGANGAWHAAYGTADGGLRGDERPLLAAGEALHGSFAQLLGDTDGDGRSDVASGFEVPGYHGPGTTLRLHRAVADGGAPEVSLDARRGQSVTDLTDAGDLDADGRDEVFYLSHGTYFWGPFHTVTWGAPRGTPTASSVAPAGDGLAGVGDFDGDGVGDWGYLDERTDVERRVLGRRVQVARGAAGDRRLLTSTALGEELPPRFRVTPVR